MTDFIRLTGRAVLATALLGVVTCGGDPVQPKGDELVGIDVSPTTGTLVSLGEALQLSATGRSGTGGAMAGIVFTWSSDDTSVATVDGNGLVSAVGNGSATITASASGFKGTAGITVAQVAAVVEAVEGDLQGGTVGLPLDSILTVRVSDALGSPVEGAELTFSVTAGGGSAVPAQGVADALGHVSTVWTLGEISGTHEITAAVVGLPDVAALLQATAFASDPVVMELLDGDGQIELVTRTLPAPIRVRLVDAFGNGVPDVPITFSVAADDVLDLTEVPTDLDGIAAATWTLGATLGVYVATAILPDSTVGDIVSLPGSPVSFTSTAVTYAVAGVTPAPPVVGQTMLIEGVGFDPDLAGNVVSVDGVAATVMGGSQTSLSVLVPSFGCEAARDRVITVTRGTETGTVTTPVHPANALQLAVGERRVISDPEEYCLQFLAGGSEEYLVGLTATRRLDGEMSFSLRGSDPVNPVPGVAGFAAAVEGGGAGAGYARSAEFALREWEERFMEGDVRPASPLAAGAGAGAVSAAVPLVGDFLDVRVPNITSDPCNVFVPVSARVLAVGPRVVIASDASIPSDPLITAAVTAALNTLIQGFGDQIYTLATTYFGFPTDLDLNERITVVFSPAVQAMGVPGFTSVVDHVPATTCPSSDEGEVIYVAIPAAPTLTELTDLLQGAPPGLAHQLTHVIQHARRLGAGGGALPAWVGEGQAELSVEIVGMSILGAQPRMDYGAVGVATDLLGLWYRPRFDRLSYLFGWDGGGGKLAGAPDRCSLFGFSGLSVSCRPEYAPGMAWGFLRYLSDRFGATYPGGEGAFQQAIIGLDPSTDLMTVLESLVGQAFSDIMVDWAMTVYTDGRLSAAAAPALQFQSWNLASVYGSLPAVQNLTPPTVGFLSFARSSTVVGGGTSYTLVSAPASHGSLALRVGTTADTVLSSVMAPRLWVVRMR